MGCTATPFFFPLGGGLRPPGLNCGDVQAEAMGAAILLMELWETYLPEWPAYKKHLQRSDAAGLQSSKVKRPGCLGLMIADADWVRVVRAEKK